MSLSEDSSSSHSSSLYGSFFANQPKQSHIFKQDVVDEINELNKQIEKISAQNLASRIEIEKLTSDVSAITKAISSTTECLQMDVSKLEAENQQLREDIEKERV